MHDSVGLHMSSLSCNRWHDISYMLSPAQSNIASEGATRLGQRISGRTNSVPWLYINRYLCGVCVCVRANFSLSATRFFLDRQHYIFLKCMSKCSCTTQWLRTCSLFKGCCFFGGFAQKKFSKKYTILLEIISAKPQNNWLQSLYIRIK